MIAGITQNPSRYNPISHPENNQERRAKVLKNMLEQEYITQAEYDEAMADDVYSRIQVVNAETADDSINSYFVDALTDVLMDDLLAAGYNETQAYTLLYSGGLQIYSTQDPDIQAATLSPSYGMLNGYELCENEARNYERHGLATPV